MLIVLVLVTVAVAVWAHWLVREGAPRWARAIAPVIVASTMVSGVYSLWALHDTFDAVASQSPAEKQQTLASGVGHAAWAVGLGCLVALIAIVLCAILTLRRRPR
jgi:hypothetical protein